jgi:hypothetical protein
LEKWFITAIHLEVSIMNTVAGHAIKIAAISAQIPTFQQAGQVLSATQ